MSNAPSYTPTISFATEETNSVAGRSTVRTTAVDNELANVSSSINALKTNIELMQRDDGKLKDAVVEPYALSEQTRALIASGGNPRGNWAQNTEYKKGDAVQYSSTAYLCVTDHNSGTVFSSALWLAISGDGASFTYANQSAASATQSASSASAAATSASAASTSASNANTSATNASNSATNAANSASSAASLIASSIAGASQAEAEAGVNNTKYMSPLRVKQASTAKNLLRNAQGLINQRAVSGTVTLAAGAYGHDGFVAGAAGCTYTFNTTNGITTFTISAGTLAQMVRGTRLNGGTNTHCLSNTGTAQMRINSGAYTSSQVTASLTYGTNVRCEFGIGTVILPQLEIGSTRTMFEYKTEPQYFDDCLTELTIGYVQYRAVGITTGSFGYYIECFPRPMSATPSVIINTATFSTSNITSVTSLSIDRFRSIRFITHATTAVQDVYYIQSGGVFFNSCEVPYA